MELICKKVGTNIFSDPATVEHENSGGLTKSSFCGHKAQSSKYVVWEVIFMICRKINSGRISLRDLEWTFFCQNL
jgi:hypothetical protein